MLFPHMICMDCRQRVAPELVSRCCLLLPQGDLSPIEHPYTYIMFLGPDAQACSAPPLFSVPVASCLLAAIPAPEGGTRSSMSIRLP